MGGESHSPLLTEYSVSIDYTMSLKEMIKAGNYNWKNDDITDAHFPITGEGTADVKLRLICLARTATTKEVEEHLTAMDLRSATLAELLAFGATYPDKQREFPIVALGSSWVGPGSNRGVPCLDRGSDGRRGLGLDWDAPGDEWGDYYGFLAVSK